MGGYQEEGPRNKPEVEEVPGEISDRDSIKPGEQEESREGSDKASGEDLHEEQ